ncbi:MAG TPA: ABC-F family ATP-binding cassette domain-containing protein [Nocardioides sp.]|jgi:macrolide transport system ATP-binding/permease protein|uniref:ABC-F family ATP-binding cassette domain-containing protein n=1 Tax=Nocardioides sp. TaxID=35761 RepID=UPI002E2F109C|nr:ABC-F family ATP-binding cassette domain-containing protein [Nocardioides sp.]HEX3932093.1 ABC-F family ATP-binding cassette domain-containing protein [Nocardioides sp.]
MPDSAKLLPVVRTTGLDVLLGTRRVLHDIDLTAPPGRRIGLVGENGSGKTTLLRAIAGTLPARAMVTGEIERPPDVAMLGQEPPFGDAQTIGDVLAGALAPLRRLVRDVERLSLELTDESGELAATAYADVLDEAVARDAWGADRRAAEAAERLGLGALDPERRIGTLSGGQRTRLALATLMTTRPACLLLDEPTNHLDDAAIDLLSAFLGGLPGVVLLASHDRVLLDDVCTDLFDLDPRPEGELGTDGQGGRRFGGGWTAYEEHRAAARRRWEETYAEQQDELTRLRAASQIDSSAIAHNRPPRDNDKHIYGFKGANVQRTLARRKRDAGRRLDAAEREQVRRPRPPLRLRGDLTGGHGAAGRVVQIRDVVVDGRLALARLDVTAGGHVLVSGPNGSGKSTLLGVISGRLAPTSGSVVVAAHRVAELMQDARFPDPERSAAETYVAALGAQRAARIPLRDLGLVPPDRQVTPVALLSVGQRRRLALAIAIAGEPDLLLLDEPTNHLSLSLAGEIEEALRVTAGTVVVASHDRWLRRRWDGAELALPSADALD